MNPLELAGACLIAGACGAFVFVAAVFAVGAAEDAWMRRRARRGR